MKTRVVAAAALAVVLLSIGALISCKKSESPQPAQSTGQTAQTSNAEQQPQRNPDRNAYFGEEHIHTSWSVDAWLMGNRITGPDEPSSMRRAKPSSIPWATTSRSIRPWTSWV